MFAAVLIALLSVCVPLTTSSPAPMPSQNAQASNSTGTQASPPGHPIVDCPAKGSLRMCCGDVVPATDPRVAILPLLKSEVKISPKEGDVGLNCDILPSVRVAKVLGRCGGKIACCKGLEGKVGRQCEFVIEGLHS